MNILGVGEIIKGVGNIVDDLYLSDEEEQKIALQEKRLETEKLTAQTGVNQVEASHKSVFVAGWRPFVGWIGGIALLYQFLLYPLCLWLWVTMQSQGWVPLDLSAPPVLDAEELWVLLSGMLGVAGMRSYDKGKRTQTDYLRRSR
jgi:Holin of 3TMs, for gene-transfer release